MRARRTNVTNSIVLQLQERALNSANPVSDLLRLALVAAKKLDRSDIESWLSLELNGYQGEHDLESIPPYRRVKGKVVAWNPYNGWIPVIIKNAAYERAVTERTIGSSVSELESLLKDGGGTLTMQFTPKIREALMRDAELPLEPVLQIPESVVRGALDAIRTKILEWSLELERAGVLGEGLQFSANERAAASSVTYNINNLGVLGDVSDQARVKNIQHVAEINLNHVSDLLDQIEKVKGSLEAPLRNGIEPHVMDLRRELEKPSPDRDIVRKGLRSIRTICEGAAGSLIASGILSALAGIG